MLLDYYSDDRTWGGGSYIHERKKIWMPFNIGNENKTLIHINMPACDVAVLQTNTFH